VSDPKRSGTDENATEQTGLPEADLCLTDSPSITWSRLSAISRAVAYLSPARFDNAFRQMTSSSLGIWLSYYVPEHARMGSARP
jgi:hypothetical protein